jgi:hypothetical protein
LLKTNKLTQDKIIKIITFKNIKIMKSLFKVTFAAIFAVLLNFQATAQVKIGLNPTVRNADSELEIESTDKGLLLPRVALTSTTSFAPMSAHVAGMTVYNTAATGDVVAGYYYNDGSKWVQLGASSNAWKITGNAATTPPTQVGTAVGATNYWGTSDAQNLALGTNAKTRMIFDQKNNAFGGNLNTMAADSNTLVWGGSNIVSPNGHSSLVVGHKNVDSSNFSLVFGLGNSLGAGANDLYNTNRGTILGGDGNVVTAGRSYNSIINGSNNKVYGDCFESIITGYQTTVSNSQKVVVSGRGHNVTNATGSAVFGNFSTVNAAHTLVAGSGHLADVGSDYTAIFGNTNKAYGLNSLVAGTTNIDSSQNSLVFGNGNILGSGLGYSAGNRSNRGTILGGGDNVVKGGETYNSMINGSRNNVIGSCFESIIIGYQTNVTNSQKVVVSGQNHVVTNATGSAVFGNFSLVSAPSALVAGAGNTVAAGANYGIALGESNTVDVNHTNGMAIGKSAKTYGVGQFSATFAGGYLLASNAGATTGMYIAAGASSWTALSDRRAKDNIKDISYGLNTVMQLRPTMYNYKGQKNTSLGFIAQEVKEIMPEVIEQTNLGPNHDYLGIKYTDMIPVITKAVQELKKENDTLKQEVAQLKAQMEGIASLAAQVKELQALVSNNKAVNATEATVKTGKK